MKIKRLCALILVLALSAGFVCHAQSYVKASSRINFYYQHEGGARNEPGIWDTMLRDRLLALSGHNSIYYDSSTDRYLTGRGCCLFSFAHAYQYLLGYAASASQKAGILYKYLSIKPVWSNKNSTLSPPNAHTFYAAYLAKQSGVRTYSKSKLNSFSALRNFFEGGKGVLIVNAPGHYIIAVGAVKHGGTEYVQVVDSILSATVRTGRLSYGKSMDFSVTYTPDNASRYEEKVHEYWIPYSEFKSRCTVRYAFTSGSAPRENRFKLVKDTVLLPEGQTYTLTLEGTADILAYESLDPEICTVDAMGALNWLDEGQAQVRIYAPDNPQNEVYADIYCIQPEENPTVIAETGRAVPDPFSLDLPNGAKVECDPAVPETTGMTEAVYTILDSYGDAVWSTLAQLAVIDPDKLLLLPEGLKTVETGAFEENGAESVYIPETVIRLESGAFDHTNVRIVIAACQETALQSGAFPEGTSVICDKAAIERWLKNE